MVNSTDQLLARVPEFISVPGLFKALPVSEGGRRYVYVEASNETLDQQGEVVLSAALADSADYYKQFGNLDIDHITQVGAKQGIPDYSMYEIGRPVDVRVQAGRTFVKGELYSGLGPAAERANQVWSSLTEINPPARWYPSVGGAVLEKSAALDPATGQRRAYVTKVRWTNVAFSKTPVNQSVAAAQTVPMQVFAKCWGALGLDWGSVEDGQMALKALEAGYGTDSASLTGGAALRTQSLHGAVLSYASFRDRLAGLIRAGKGGGTGARRLVALATGELGLSQDRASKWVERFLRDLNAHLERSKS
jgi:hypothetical protein